MRTLRLSLVGAAILALLGAVDGAVLAQEDEEPGLVIPVTLTQTEDGTELEPQACTTHPGHAQTTCIGTASFPLSATDSRLSGMATERVIEHFFEGAPGAIVEAYDIEIVNDGGTWVGAGLVFVSRHAHVGPLYTLTGEGEYEGFTAVLTVDEDDDIRGLIIDGELPASVALPAE